MTRRTRPGRPGALRATYTEAAIAVEAEASPETAFRLATQLRAEADGIVRDAAILRARMADRLLRAEGMSLAQLAERLGTSKARADQLIRTARSADDEAARS
jgi:hypothetical protein